MKLVPGEWHRTPSIDSDDGLVPSGNKSWLTTWRFQAITFTNAHLLSTRFCGIHLSLFPAMPKLLLCINNKKILLFKLLPVLSEACELMFHVSFFARVLNKADPLCFKRWLGTKQATCHYLNQCWLLTHTIHISRVLDKTGPHWFR